MCRAEANGLVNELLRGFVIPPVTFNTIVVHVSALHVVTVHELVRYHLLSHRGRALYSTSLGLV